jgi:hypothetical protein
VIHFVVALREEARPLIEHYRLRGESERSAWALYRSDEVRLVVSGIGRVAAAGATAFLAAQSSDPRTIWINFGMAAHRSLEMGACVAGSEVIESATGRRWYPPLIGAGDLASASVCTVDAMATHLDDDRLYEMEAAGFYPTAVRWASSELVRVLKVVSDRGESSCEAFDRGQVEGLAAGALEALDEQVASLEQLAGRLPEPIEPQPGVLGERWRLSVTQRRRLDRQIRRAAALGCDVKGFDLGECSSATAALDLIDSQLDGLPILRP